MDWSTIILALLSGTSVASLFEAWRYRKLNKQMKQNEATQSDVETQEKEINLANLYRDEMLKLMNVLQENQTENVGNQKEMLDKLNNLEKRTDEQDVKLNAIHERLETVETNVSDMATYLNGEYKSFLANRTKKSKK